MDERGNMKDERERREMEDEREMEKGRWKKEGNIES